MAQGGPAGPPGARGLRQLSLPIRGSAPEYSHDLIHLSCKADINSQSVGLQLVATKLIVIHGGIEPESRN